MELVERRMTEKQIMDLVHYWADQLKLLQYAGELTAEEAWEQAEIAKAWALDELKFRYGPQVELGDDG